jgi:predicted transposase/invertase (TIGR01784 family)
MALRMLTYILLFYQDMISGAKGKIEKLPPVFPILLHSGMDKWRAPENISELIGDSPRGMEPFIPNFRYYKISENQLDRRELDKLENLVAKLFSLEMSSLGEMSEVATELLKMLKHNVPRELQKDFGRWIRSVFSIRDKNVDLTKLDDTEVKTMLAEAIKLHEEKLIAEAMLQGKLQGLEEGELKGKLEGKLEIAKNMLRAGISASQIVELTGLSLDEVSKLSH